MAASSRLSGGGDQGPAVEFDAGVSWREDRRLVCESETMAIAGDDHGLRVLGERDLVVVSGGE